MKKNYTSASIEFMALHVNDVITSSPLTIQNGGDGDEFNFDHLFA